MKYRITSETKVVNNITLHRIECVTAFDDIECGEKGGWIESKKNLSQCGSAWVDDNATVSGDAEVGGNVLVGDNAVVGDNAKVGGNAIVREDSVVIGNAKVGGNACVGGNAVVRENADYIVFKNWWSSGRYFTWTRSNNKWTVGCFYGSGEELIKKAYKDSEKSGREYERVVNYVNDILKEDNDNGNRNKREG